MLEEIVWLIKMSMVFIDAFFNSAKRNRLFTSMVEGDV